MKKKVFRISCAVIIALQLLSAFAVSYMSTVLSDTLQLFFGPLLLVAMLDSAPYFVVESLVKLILKKSTERAKQIIILIISLISEIIVSIVWIHFMVILLEFCSDSYYMFDIIFADEIIMFFPVAAVLLLTVLYIISRLGIKIPKKKKRRKNKKRKTKSRKTAGVKDAGAESSSGTSEADTIQRESEI